jgi:uncharacterized cupredoxin-like copper-binding protein
MKKISVILLLGLVMMAIVACGPRKKLLSTKMSDFKFTPDVWVVPTGAEVTLKIKNEGTLDHEFVIMLLGTDATIPFDDDDEPHVYWETELAPGDSNTVTLIAPDQPGLYHIVCGTAGHLEQGMRGILTVK